MNFFESYYEAAKNLSDKDRHAFYDQLFGYYFDGVEIELTGAAAAVWAAVKPVVTKSLRKSTAGKEGGRPKANEKQTESKRKANEKQTESKRKANQKQIKSKSKAENDFAFTESEKQTESHMDMDMEKDMDNNPPLSPLWGEETHDYAKHTNLENVKHVLNAGIYGDAAYFREHTVLWEIVKTWMSYKDDKKPRTSNHYVNADSICTLLNKFVKNDREYGTDAVRGVVEETMSQTWQGIVWEKLVSRSARGYPAQSTGDAKEIIRRWADDEA